MAIEFECDGCRKLLRTTDDKAGMRAKCPHCGTMFTTPFPPRESSDEYETGPAYRRGYEDDEVPAEDAFSRHFGNSSAPAAPAPATYQPVASSQATKLCPMCGESIAASSQHCQYCGERFRGRNERDVRPGRSQALPTSTMAVVSLVLAIVGLAVFCVPGLTIACSVAALVFGIIGWNQTRNATHQGEGVAIAGLALSGLGLVVSLLSMVFWVLRWNNGF